jgi:hypothetical protein
MPGIYKKNELKLKALKLRNPYENIEELFGRPQRLYNISTLGLSPTYVSEFVETTETAKSSSSRYEPSSTAAQSEPQKGQNDLGAYKGTFDNGRDIAGGYNIASSVIGAVGNNITKPLEVLNKVTGYAAPVLDVSRVVPMVEMGATASTATDAARAASEAADIARATASETQLLPEAISTIAKVGEGVGKVAGAAGAALSGVSLGMDIANAVKDKKVTFDNAMRMADDGTGLVASAVGLIPGVGTALSLGLLGGEKVVTAIIKGAKAVKDMKKELGVKHLKPGVWLNTVVNASVPSWMTKDIGEAYREWKKNKPQRDAEKKAAKAQAKAEWKKMSGKEKAKKFFFG